MLGKLRKLIRKSPMYTIPVVIFVLLLTAAMNVYQTKLDGDRIDNYRATIQKQHTEQEWNEISTIINLSFAASKQNSKFLAQKVEVDLLRQYQNLDVLKQEFEKKEFSQGFYDILKKNLLVENGAPSSLYPLSYNTLVGMQDGIIALFSDEATTNITNPDQEAVVQWDSYVGVNSNPTLAKKAIESVVNREDGIIFLQTESTGRGVLEKNTAMTMDTLKKAYLEYGIDGLDYYSILTPSYITDTGDIFNTDDKTFMTKNHNYKMILVQSVSISDLLANYEKELYSNETVATQNVTFLAEFVSSRNIQAITWSFLLFVLSLILIHIYNTERRCMQEEKQETEGDVNSKKRG